MFWRGKRENRPKLEHKLYLARENPEPVFDLSECDLRNVPEGIYSLCRVFRKEYLNLAHNNLINLKGGGLLKDLHLLTRLSINNNAFTHLPDDIDQLTNLEELYIQYNQIIHLPKSICNLCNLRVLDVSNNQLKDLPQDIGNLMQLRSLYLKANLRLRILPKSLHKLRCLCKLEVDNVANFKYPPSEVLELGIEAIRKFICDENNYEYSPHTEMHEVNSDEKNYEDEPYTHLEAKIWKLEQIKACLYINIYFAWLVCVSLTEQKLQEFLAIERHNELMNRQELELANSLKTNKNKLLADIVDQQNKLESSLDKVQQLKDVERFKLIEQLQGAEQAADIAISELLRINKEPFSLYLEQEQVEHEQILAAAHKRDENLRKTEILKAMEELLEIESHRFQQVDKSRMEISRSILSQEMETDSHLSCLLKQQDIKAQELTEKLMEDSELQKMALTALLEKSDARSWSLIQQFKLVGAQLAALTLIEMDRKKLRMDEQLNDLAVKRTHLSALLVDLLVQQGVRRMQLLSTIQTLEENQVDTSDFWLMQYQQLLDRMPAGFTEFQKNLNPALLEALLMEGVLNYLPFFAKWAHSEEKLLDVSDEDLQESGITNFSDRQHILHAFQVYRNHKSNADVLPSAPPEMEFAASAPIIETTPSYGTSECVVCMDSNCEIIFVPCGHFCCCSNCTFTLRECPMCRTDIDRKIRVEQS